MTARETFFGRIGLLRDLAADSLLTDVFPPNVDHNIRATILRNGLVVSSFSLLEKYLQDRIEENCDSLNHWRLSYSAFSDPMKRLFSIDAIAGLNNRINFVDKADRRAFAEAALQKLLGSAPGSFGYTGFGFSSKGSNVSSDDVHTLLSAFAVNNPWQTLSTIVSTLGSSRIDLKNDFVNLARARNKGAHDSTFNIASADLSTHLDTALLVGLSVDVALTCAVEAHRSARNLVDAARAANPTTFRYRFIDQDYDHTWKERVSTSGRTIKRYRDRPSAKAGALSRSDRSSIVFRDLRSIPIELL